MWASFEETTCSARYILHLQDWTSAVDHVPVRNSNYEGQSSLTSIGLYKQHIWSFSGCEYDAIDTHIMLRARNFVTKILCWRSPVGVPACAHWTFLWSFYFPILKHLCHSASRHLLLKDVVTVEQCYRCKSKVTNNDCNNGDICKHTVNRDSNLNDNTTWALGIKCTGQYV